MAASPTIAPAPNCATPAQSPVAADAARAGGVVHGALRQGIALRTAEEVAAIRSAGALAAEALEAARAACVAGSTAREIDRAVRRTIEAGGGEPLFLGYVGVGARPPFPAASCVSVNEQLVHAVPGDRVIGHGDLVSIDVGVRLSGWCADTATTVAVGDISPDRADMLSCAEGMLAHAVSMIVPGRRWSSIAEDLGSMAERAGFSVAVDFVGHGIGRTLHEPPQVPCVWNGSTTHRDFTLRPGMVLAIEPMLVLERPVRDETDGRLVSPRTTTGADGWTVTVDSGAVSCHFEHTVAVTRVGADVLTTRATHDSGTRTRPGLRRAG